MDRSHHSFKCPWHPVGLSILLIFSLISTIHTNESCPDEDINFFLYTKENPSEAHQVFVNWTDSNLRDTHFVATNPTKIIVHGWHSSVHEDHLMAIKNEYLIKEPMNIIAVNWDRLAAAHYLKVVLQVSQVGKCLAQLIKRLRDHNATNIHVIGHSLGAHVAARSAAILRPYKVDRITGLDPAMPWFATVGEEEKLDAGDAEFVDVIHTNSMILGKLEYSGHIDFYVNSGVTQPGCWGGINTIHCYHRRAATYFAESVNSMVGFWGWSCSCFSYITRSCSPKLPAVRMGDAVDRNARGFHLVKTEAVAPYAKWPFSVPQPNIDNGWSLTSFPKKMMKIVSKKCESISHGIGSLYRSLIST